MGRRQENEKEFKVQSYFRLLRYARPYWFRLTVGILAGFMVGGSLFASFMLVPDLLNAIETKTGASATHASHAAQEIVEKIESSELTEEQKIREIEKLLDPAHPDDKLARSLKKLERYKDRFGLPLDIGKRSVTLTWPVRATLPLVDEGGRMSWQFFSLFVFGFILTWTLKNLGTYVNHYYTRWVGARVIADLRNEVFNKLLGQSMKFYGKMDIGHLISRCTNDTSAIETSVANTIADLTRCPVEILACVSAIIVLSWQFQNYMLLVILGIGMPLVVLPIVILGRKIRKIYKRSFSRIAEVISRMHEVFTGILIIKACNTEKSEMNRFRQVNRKYFRTVVHALKMQLLMNPMMEVVAVASTLVFLVYAYSQQVELENLAILLLPAFMAYPPIKSLAKVTTYLQRSMAAADRYFDLIDAHTEITEKPDAVDLPGLEREISFNNVVFAYDDRRILDNVSFTIPKGHLVAVVGETGSGKTTIANLIARFYDITSGSVRIDDIDVRDVKIKSLREHIGIVTQNPILFNETIGYNIAYGCPDATPEQIVDAAKLANAHQFITDGRHGEGYETEVGEKGFKLSGGEKQRIAIARAILKNPPILILDEATSALDTVTEKLVQEALNRAMRNRTVFAIAHRLSTIRHADMIIVLKNGKIIERGRHDELLAINGVYKNLFETQFQSNDVSLSEAEQQGAT